MVVTFSDMTRFHCSIALCVCYGSKLFLFQLVKFALLLVGFSLPAPWWYWQLVLTAQLLPISFTQTAVVAGGNATIHLCARGYFPGKTYQTPGASHHLSLIWWTLLNRLFGTQAFVLFSAEEGVTGTCCLDDLAPKYRLVENIYFCAIRYPDMSVISQTPHIRPLVTQIAISQLMEWWNWEKTRLIQTRWKNRLASFMLADDAWESAVSRISFGTSLSQTVC